MPRTPQTHPDPSRASSDPDLGLSIVIPVFNESAVIAGVLDGLLTFLDGYAKPYEIICVNDCSKDNSSEVIRGFPRVRLLEHMRNKGYGAALKTGIRAARHEVVLIMDSDGQHSPDLIPPLAEAFDRGYDMVIGARPMANTNLARVPGKYLLNLTANLLLGEKIQDLNSGLRIFRKSHAQAYFHLCSNRFSFTTSLTLAYLSDGKEVGYVDITVNRRAGGKSMVNILAGLRTYLKILQIVVVFKPLRLFLPITGAIGLLALTSLTLDIISGDLGDSTVLLGISTIILFVFSLLSDQLSSLRREIKVE